MKLSKATLLLTILTAFLLSSCTNATAQATVGDSLRLVAAASQRTTELANGKYTFIMVQEAPSERQTEAIEGVFQNREGTYDWHTRLSYSPSGGRSVTDRAQKDQVQYLRIGLLNQEGQFADDDGLPLAEAPAWRTVAEDIIDQPPYLALLTELALTEADIETVEVREEAGIITCIYTYSKDYLSAQKKADIAEVEEQLRKAKQENRDFQLIQSLEQTVAYQKSLDYEAATLSFMINEFGVLVSYFLDSSYEYTLSDRAYALRQQKRLELLEYNLPDLEVASPGKTT